MFWLIFLLIDLIDIFILFENENSLIEYQFIVLNYKYWTLMERNWNFCAVSWYFVWWHSGSNWYESFRWCIVEEKRRLNWFHFFWSEIKKRHARYRNNNDSNDDDVNDNDDCMTGPCNRVYKCKIISTRSYLISRGQFLALVDNIADYNTKWSSTRKHDRVLQCCLEELPGGITYLTGSRK